MKVYNSLLKIYRNLSIRQKLLMLFSIQIIIPVLFMGLMLYRNTENIVTNKSITYAMDIVKMIELRIDDFDKEIKSASQDFLYDRNLYEVLSDDEKEPFEYYQKVSEIRDMLRRVNLSKDMIQSMAIVTNEGEFITYDTNSAKAIIGDVMPYEAIKERAKSAAGVATWFFESDENDRVIRTYLVRTIYDIADHKELGIVAILIKQNELDKIYSELSPEFMNSIMILSNNRKIISVTNEIPMTTLEKEIYSRETLKSGYYVDETTDMLLTHQLVEGNGWLVVTQVSLKDLNQDLEGFKYMLVIVTILTLLILSIFTILMAMDIIDPINRLVASIKKMQNKNTYEAVLVDRNDELGYLSECFNTMSKEIDVLLNEVYREHLTRKEAELKALQAQINPHFLFNTLESINWMALLKDAPEISEMVTALSTLMEASIGKGTSLVSLTDEIEHAQSYVLIMKNRYGERLEFTTSLDEAMMKVKIPKLTLQPIIENAIYHGIDKVRKGGKISLTVEQRSENCLIIVEDNGKGMSHKDANRLNTMFRAYNDDYLSNEGKNSIGLINVNHRIKLYCGDDYGIEVKSWFEHGTKVIISVPVTIEKLRNEDKSDEVRRP